MSNNQPDARPVALQAMNGEMAMQNPVVIVTNQPDARLADELEAELAKCTPSQWLVVDGESSSFVYAANDDGWNRMDFNIQPGLVSHGNRTSQLELHANAKLIALLKNNAQTFIDRLRSPGAAADAWMPIESAPKNKSVLLTVLDHFPVYCGQHRYGQLGEPQQTVLAWRCDSSGRFVNPTHWQPLPLPPSQSQQGV